MNILGLSSLPGNARVWSPHKVEVLAGLGGQLGRGGLGANARQIGSFVLHRLLLEELSVLCDWCIRCTHTSTTAAWRTVCSLWLAHTLHTHINNCCLKNCVFFVTGAYAAQTHQQLLLEELCVLCDWCIRCTNTSTTVAWRTVCCLWLVHTLHKHINNCCITNS